jgi:hypothetical protein
MIESDDRSMVRRLARNRTTRLLAGLLVSAILIGLLAAWLSRGEFKGRYAIPEAGHDGTSASIAAPVPARPAPVAPKVIAPAPRPAPVVAPPGAPDADTDADTSSDDDSDQQRMARAIERAARKALDRGEPVHWHKAGESGYVVVSEPRDIGDRVCRNVSATIEGDDGQTQSNSHMWCQSDEDGDWQPME